MEDTKRFILIDGNAIVHRAFHALPPLTYNGKVLNAAYGFFSMFLKIIEDMKPTYIAVCFDRPKPTFRKQLYVGYQAKRPEMASDLVPQISVIHDVLEKAGIALYELDGYEADDLIGTLAAQAARINTNTTNNTNQQISNKKKKDIGLLEIGNWKLEIIIVSGDRDLLQLVNSHVKVLAPITGITKMLLFDEKAVEEKYGLKPSQFVDYKALIGDASDNYPGVTGIGPKTASNLLREFGTFENLYEHLGDVSPRISEKLATDAEQAALAKKLATIVTDAPVHIDLEKCSMNKYDTEKFKKALADLGFKSILSRIPQAGGDSLPAVRQEKEVYVNEMTHLEEKPQPEEIGQVKVKKKLNKTNKGQLDLL